jgi:hypothetical protein
VTTPASPTNQKIRPYNGERIKTPGIYEFVPFDLYHGDLCDALSVSASTLTALHNTCPARAFAHHYSNPDQVPHENSDATEFGQQAHCFLVEGERTFNQRYAFKPAGLSLATKEGRLWKAAHAGQDYISAEDHEDLKGMREALMTHPHARLAFRVGRPEVSCVVKDKETGLWLKTRPDYLRLGLALDYKTTRVTSRDAWRRQAVSLCYHVSAAFCIDIMAELGEPVNYAFVVQEKSPPYCVAVRVLSEEFVAAGRQIYRAALRNFADCFAKNEWPSYPDVETIEMPAWAQRQLTVET